MLRIRGKPVRKKKNADSLPAQGKKGRAVMGTVTIIHVEREKSVKSTKKRGEAGDHQKKKSGKKKRGASGGCVTDNMCHSDTDEKAGGSQAEESGGTILRVVPLFVIAS